ncbi:MAG TPA: PilZ domain-containing protein, partial [Gemmataceae bacterium]|nr:PilZ domain-containing protein [Gemmataceae bacterium]
MSTPIGLPEETTPPELSGVERRVLPRHPILQRCLVWPPGTLGTEGWRCIVHNISTTGIGISLPCPLQPGTVLRVEAWGLPGAPPLLARVVFAKRLGFL